MTKLDSWKTTFAIFLFCALAVTASSAQTFTTLMSFDDINGSDPTAALVQGLDGNFYGATVFGGTGDDQCGYDGRSECGTVFKITRGGKLTTLHNFVLSEGGNPYGLVLASDGNFYGTTDGGAAKCGHGGGCGTFFKVTSTGKLTTLYGFCSQGNCTDGIYPNGGLVQGSDGNFYGTTSQGGDSSYCPYYDDGLACGTVFKITRDGKLTTLYTFCTQANCSDGAIPRAGLIQGTDGDFYGTTSEGGTVFKITSTGKLTTLYRFCSQANCPDGEFPYGKLVQAADGNFYGTTLLGGTNACGPYQPGCGTVFKITPAGKLTTLYSFCTQSNCADGNSPWAGLIQGTDGALYGTTSQGGFYAPSCSYYNLGCGTAFKITPAGVLTTLYTFCMTQGNCADGADPVAGLVQATDGNFYGTTAIGGGTTGYDCPTIGCGTVFTLSTGLGPFVSLLRDSGKVGQTGGILGQGLTGTTGVFLNGTSASFTIVSDTFIRAIVPVGATTGFVTVETRSGTLRSNVPFYVLP